MEFIVKALRDTYYNERKAYSGLNDLINMLEDPQYSEDYFAILYNINDLLHDIHLPIQEKPLD